jgi:hypothetical protein
MDFAAGVSPVRGPVPSHDLILLLPPYTLYTCIGYTYLYRDGGGGKGELTRGKVRWAMLHKAGRNTNKTDCISSL